MLNKYINLEKFLKSKEKQGICLAFSGGIDSTLLLYMCKNMNITAVTFDSDFQSRDEILQTKELCCHFGVKQKIISIKTLKNPLLVNNPKDRCYHCKKLLFSELKKYAKENNLKYLIDGTNFDDLSVYRPGLQALKEMEISSPLAEFGITKSEIREYAKQIGIPNYEKPSMPCLATRFPYGTKLEANKISIAENGEKILKSLGFENNRFRIHGDIIRIEIPQDKFTLLLDKKNLLLHEVKKLGIKYITLDLEGLRSGSMD